MYLQLAEDENQGLYCPVQTNQGTIYVREDLADEMFLSGRGRARRDEKRALKTEKKRAKTDIKKARAEKKRASGEAKKIKANAKLTKAGAGGGDDEPSDFDRISGKAFDTIGKGLNVYRQIKGGGAPGDEESTNSDTSAMARTPGATEESFFSKYKTPLLIGGGLILAGGLFLALRKKK